MLRVVAVCAAFLIVPTAGFAQAPPVPPVDIERWGVQVSFTPKFEMNGGGGAIDKLAEVMFTNGDEGLDVSGGDFRIGVVRGRRLGGEWGVSYVHRSFDEESTQGAGAETSCFTNDFNQVTTCHTSGTEYLYTQGITLDAVEVNKLINFVTIKNVVQIGLDVAGGVGWMKGTAIERSTQSEGGGFSNVPPGTTINFPFTVTDTEIPASELMSIDPAWIGRVEAAVGVLLGPQLKVRVSGGLNIPGTQLFSVTGSFFF